MDFCNKCGEQLAPYEPCFRLSYGFKISEVFSEDDSIILHMDCMNDEEIYNIIIDRIKKN
jgi:hypothetical protein